MAGTAQQQIVAVSLSRWLVMNERRSNLSFYMTFLKGYLVS